MNYEDPKVSFGIGRHMIPDIDQIPVKRPLTTEDFPRARPGRNIARPTRTSKSEFLLFEVDAHVISKIVRLLPNKKRGCYTALFV